MKKIKIILCLIVLFALSGCIDNKSMENIDITTSAYPIKYVIEELYGKHSKVSSIYPTDSDIEELEITSVSLNQYSKSDMFIFNGMTDEKKYIKTMIKNNKDLKIIDVSSNMFIDYSIEELWLDPNNLLTIANNIKKGFNEYIDSSYLLDEIENNYNDLKANLTNLDGKYYSVARNSSNPTIIISDNAFKYLEKYGINVISLDKETRTDKDIAIAKELVNNGSVKYVFIKYKEIINDTVQDLIDSGLISKELYSMTNLSDVNLEQNNYISLMNQNLESLKDELLK